MARRASLLTQANTGPLSPLWPRRVYYLSPLSLLLQRVPVHLASPTLFCSGPEESTCRLPTPRTLGDTLWPPGSHIALFPPQILLWPVLWGALPLHPGEGFLLLFLISPSSPSGLSLSPGNCTSSPSTLAKHAMFLLSTHRLSKFGIVSLHYEGVPKTGADLKGCSREGLGSFLGHWLGWLRQNKIHYPGGGSREIHRLTLQTCPICHGPVRALPEFPLLSKGRPPGSAERGPRYKPNSKNHQFQAAASPPPLPVPLPWALPSSTPSGGWCGPAWP